MSKSLPKKLIGRCYRILPAVKAGTTMKAIAAVIMLTALLIGLPILGATSTGHPMSLYLEFPPYTRYVQHAPFSWPAFALAGIGALFTGALFVFLYLPRRHETYLITSRRHFPWWGWVSGFFILCFWILAWERPGWFKPLQNITFTPLWISYVIFVNALTFR